MPPTLLFGQNFEQVCRAEGDFFCFRIGDATRNGDHRFAVIDSNTMFDLYGVTPRLVDLLAGAEFIRKWSRLNFRLGWS